MTKEKDKAQTAQEGQEQHRATDPRCSVWVSAHAGSGKTHVLTNRVMRLLLSGVRAERILCLTFTKAAAAEMAMRLHKRLGEWAFRPEIELKEEIKHLTGSAPDDTVLRTARLLFARISDTSEGLRIQTIHAFCQSVLRRFPIEAGISPSFRVMDEHAAKDMLKQAQNTLLAASDPMDYPLNIITHETSDMVFAEIFAEIILKRRELEKILPRHKKKIETLTKNWGLTPDDNYENLRQKIITERNDDLLIRAAMALQNSDSATDITRGSDIFRYINENNKISFVESYLKIFFTDKNQPRKTLITKQCESKNLGTRDILIGEQQRLARLTEKANAARAFRLASALASMAEKFLTIFTALKAKKGLLDYDDLITKTDQLFDSRRAAAWVLYRLDGGLDHILIDEAQDTNPEQWHLIQSLTGEFFAGQGAQNGGEENHRTLFAVGDPKQSIFSFQGVEPDDFEQMQKSFAQKVQDAKKNWQDVSLDISFRSLPEILHLVDKVFSQTETKLHDGADKNALTHHADRDEERGQCEIWPIFEDISKDSEDENNPSPDGAKRLAQTITAKIADLVHGEKAAKLGEILILVRRRNIFVEHLMRELKAQNLPVAGADRLQLDQHLAVMDLISLAKFVLLPEDDLSLAEILKSPLCGLSEEQVMALALGKNRQKHSFSLWAELGRQQHQHRAAYDFLSRALRRADFVPVFEFFSEILETQNMRARMAASLGAEVHDPLDEFLNLALAFEQAQTPSLQGFVHWLERINAEVKRDMERGRDEIRIMTVHGAKGLEAKVVFLVDVPPQNPAHRWMPMRLAAKGKSNGEYAPFWRMTDMPLQKIESMRDQDKIQENYEENRLLYVAMTRARDRLYVCGYHKKGDSHPRWLPLIAPCGNTTSPPKIKKPEQTPLLDESKKDLPDWADPSLAVQTIAKTEDRKLSPSDFAHDQQPETKKSFSLLAANAESSQSHAALAGSMMHEALRHAPKIKEKELTALLQRLFHDSAAKDCQQIAQMAQALIGHPDFAAYFQTGRAEVPVEALFADQKSRLIISGRIDRLILDENNHRAQIIDYKTDKNPPANAAQMPPGYQKQLAAYRLILQKIHPDWQISAGLLWTRIPRLDWADENTLDNLAKMIISDENEQKGDAK